MSRRGLKRHISTPRRSRRTGSRLKPSRWGSSTRLSCVWASRCTGRTAGVCGPAAGPRSWPSPLTTTSPGPWIPGRAPRLSESRAASVGEGGRKFPANSRVCVCVCPRQERLWGGDACVSRMVVDKYVYLSKAGSPLVEVWDKKSETMVDSIDCAQIIRSTHTHNTQKQSFTVSTPSAYSCRKADATAAVSADTGPVGPPTARRPGPA